MKIGVKTTPLLITILSSLLYILIALNVCLYNGLSLPYYIAAFFPFIIILLTLIAAVKFNCLGGIMLVLEGILILSFLTSYYTLLDVFIPILVFSIPPTISGLYFIFIAILNYRLYRTNRAELFRLLH